MGIVIAIAAVAFVMFGGNKSADFRNSSNNTFDASSNVNIDNSNSVSNEANN